MRRMRAENETYASLHAGLWTMKYLKKLFEQLTDDKFLAIELFLFWIALSLTFLVIATILFYLQ